MIRKDKPNIVIFLSDDLGYNDLSCYSSAIHHTPNIDRLAGEGVRFTDFHSNGCMCSPTRAALLTGSYQQRCGFELMLDKAIERNGPGFTGMSSETVNFGRTFSENGYATSFLGKFHTGEIPEHSPLKIGFQEFRGIGGGMDHHSRYDRHGHLTWWVGEERAEESGYATDLITDHGLRFIEEHQDEPFLLYLADWCVHFPWQGPDDPADFAPGVDNSAVPDKWGSQYPDEHKRAYAEMVEAQDRNVGRIAAKLKELELDSNTILIFASDNGGNRMVTDNQPLRAGKSSIFEGGHRVPAFCRWPGTIQSGKVSDETVMTMDVFPTILSLTGVEAPRHHTFDGIDISNHLLSGTSLPERPLFWRYGPKAAVRSGKWKYVYEDEKEFLFDLLSDIGEENNLISTRPEIAEGLKKEMEQWAEDVAYPK